MMLTCRRKTKADGAKVFRAVPSSSFSSAKQQWTTWVAGETIHSVRRWLIAFGPEITLSLFSHRERGKAERDRKGG